ncbi:hypothetical protein SISNIDRAFT_482507 [Sistotremastrum niveocremeum HHB9708]|uniref:Uncharacterized protein n=1 Tax=Sistotremastrum niveocremeum HHB9708 TaxID=1314777 RepID=A0A164Y9N2_9AGAM|nr:hypothetical protein SISNIDRAFT_482507 [Sistotremastrum niveocremeum HHB9708]
MEGPRPSFIISFDPNAAITCERRRCPEGNIPVRPGQLGELGYRVVYDPSMPHIQKLLCAACVRHYMSRMQAANNQGAPPPPPAPPAPPAAHPGPTRFWAQLRNMAPDLTSGNFNANSDGRGAAVIASTHVGSTAQPNPNASTA